MSACWLRPLAGSFVAAALLWAGGAHALSYNLTAFLDGFQEVPPVATPATGTLTGTYDDVSNFLTWNVTYSGLIGSPTGAHFHGPAGPGTNAAIRVAIDSLSGGVGQPDHRLDHHLGRLRDGAPRRPLVRERPLDL